MYIKGKHIRLLWFLKNRYRKMNGHLGGAIPTPPYGDKGTWSPELWDKIISDHNIKSIVDIGCGYGYSTQYFLEKGIEAIGVEGYDDAIANTVFKGKLIKNDYTKDYVFKDNEKFDLVWCCEFVEHVESKYEHNFLRDFSSATYIAMTHAVPGQGGYHHVNCQEDQYWIDKVESLGYKYNKEYTEELRKIVGSLKGRGRYLRTIMFFENNKDE